MPTYTQSFISQHYNHVANPPLLDKVVFTLDHIHLGGPGKYSTFDVVQYLVSKQIPVTIFIQCPDPLNLCPNERRNARLIYDLDNSLVSLGAHSLSPGNTQSQQTDNLQLVSDVIGDITGVEPIIMSYHGGQAGPEIGISYDGIEYARGIKSNWSAAQQDNKLDTPVMSLNRVEDAFEFTRLRNLAGLSSTLFVHSAELVNGSNKKTVFDTMIQAVIEGKIQALPYLSAMKADYTNDVVPQPTPPCALSNFTNNRIVQFLRINIRDGVNGVYQVSELQAFLNEIGLVAGSVDGIFGGKTKLAVISFQIIEGLQADGIIGRNTRAVINAYCD